MSGAYTSLEDLALLAGPARSLPLYRPGPARARMSGGHQSRLRGRGMDFEEFRNYQPGDDIRTIDWRVTARTSKTQTRVYREERERPVLLVLDQGPGLFFGSQLNFKSVTAAEVMALLAWQTLHNGDRLGALLAGPQQHLEFRPQRSRQHLMRLLQQTVSLNTSLKAGLSADHQSMDKLLASTSRLAHPGSLVIVISDFHQTSPDALKELALISRHSDLMAVQIYDPMDFQLPPQGLYAVSDGQKRGLLNTRPRNNRENYLQQSRARQKLLQDHLQKYRIPLHRINAAQPTREQFIPRPGQTEDFPGGEL